MDCKNALVASLTQKVNFLEKKLQTQKPTGRKAVGYYPNDRFVRIQEIAYAKWEAEKLPRNTLIRKHPT